MDTDAKVLRDIRDLLTRIDRKLGPDGPGQCPLPPANPWNPVPWWEQLTAPWPPLTTVYCDAKGI